MSKLKDSTSASHFFHLFEGEAEMPSLMRAYDWDSHPMGSPEQWPESLKFLIRLILRSGSPMFIWWSPELYMFHNDAYLPALGKKHPQALGAKAREMWSEIWDQLGGIAEDILQGGNSFYAEELLIMLDRKGFSEETYWTFSYSPAPNDEGGVGGMFCACNEVTKSVLGQRRLKIIKNIADSTIKVRTVEEAGKLAANAIAENKEDIPFSLIYLINNEDTKALLLGKSGNLPPELAPEEVNLHQQDNLDHWSLADVWRNRRRKSILPSTNNSCLKFVSGSGSHMEVLVHPFSKPGEDKIIGIFVSALSPHLEFNSDYQNFHKLLTGQIASSLASVLSREETSRQQEELINLFQQAPVAIAILRGEKLVVELANQNMCEFWGRSYDQVINKPVFDSLPEAKGQGLEELLQDVLRKGLIHSFNEYAVELNRKGRLEKLYVNFIYYPFRNSKGIITGVIAIAVEVTEQVESRHAIEAKNKELTAINSDLDNFVYSASHDLKGPILNIQGLMRVLLPKLTSQDNESKDVVKVIDMVFQSIDRLKHTIDDLSEVSRVQKETEEESEVNIADTVKEVLADMQLSIQETNAIVQIEMESCPVRFSPKNLKSIVYNLISNAIKYRSPDRQAIIHIACNVKGNMLLFSVSDNGLGMNLKYESKIFSMFKRLHSHVEGTGVGLYIVKRIVENAGGKIEVESQIGQGSTFTVYFNL